MTIKIIHVGEDYAKVQLKSSNGTIEEHEIGLNLALALCVGTIIPNKKAFKEIADKIGNL